MVHKYPKDLVAELLRLWDQQRLAGRTLDGCRKLPEFAVLEELISTCYQVSQLREEARGLRFRVLLCAPEEIESDGSGEAMGLFSIRLNETRPYNEYELLRLAPAIDYNNSLIGVSCQQGEGLRIWGLIHSGSRWMQLIHGGSKQAAPLPPALGVYVVGSGRLLVCRGLEILAQLSGGQIITPTVSVFQSGWIAERFSQGQRELTALHRRTAVERRRGWCRIDPAFVPILYLEFFKHVISTVRRTGHGGTIISFPLGMADMLRHDNPFIDLKYRFTAGAARGQLSRIVLRIMAVLAETCGRRYGPDYLAGWSDYVAMQGGELAQLDERVFKYARFLARLTGVDGAVVSTELEVLGFGGIIQGTMERGAAVARALDPEAGQCEVERVESVGTRHRSLYYLCSKAPEVLGIVVSQDAKSRLVTWKGNMVTCWDLIPIDFA